MNKILKAILLSLPALLIVLALYVVLDISYNKLIDTSSFASILISSESKGPTNADVTIDQNADKDLDLPDGIVFTDEQIPVISYASNWSTLNVDGWETKDIPVFLGNSADILAKGAGQWIGSYFCGLGKNCILSANVSTWFYEIEDTKMGTSIIMETTYGDFEYEVTDKFTFNEDEIDILYEDLGQDSLILHTSYPRDLSASDSSKRIALVCTLKNGMQFKSKFDS